MMQRFEKAETATCSCKRSEGEGLAIEHVLCQLVILTDVMVSEVSFLYVQPSMLSRFSAFTNTKYFKHNLEKL